MIVTNTEAGIEVLCKDDFDYLRSELPREIDFYLRGRNPLTKLTIKMRATGDNQQIREEILRFTLNGDIKQILEAVNGAERLLLPKGKRPRVQDVDGTSPAD